MLSYIRTHQTKTKHKLKTGQLCFIKMNRKPLCQILTRKSTWRLGRPGKSLTEQRKKLASTRNTRSSFGELKIKISKPLRFQLAVSKEALVLKGGQTPRRKPEHSGRSGPTISHLSRKALTVCREPICYDWKEDEDALGRLTTTSLTLTERVQ